jgi:hypothetical protein
MSDILVLQVVFMVCATGTLLGSLRVVRRYLELRHERSLQSTSAADAERLARIESMVEVTAVEVERIAEANRFIAKLLADRTGPATQLGKPERVITPH